MVEVHKMKAFSLDIQCGGNGGQGLLHQVRLRSAPRDQNAATVQRGPRRATAT